MNIHIKQFFIHLFSMIVNMLKKIIQNYEQ